MFIRSRASTFRVEDIWTKGLLVLHVYLDRESQYRLISCMRMKTCMKMVAVSGYASGRG